MIYYLSIPSPIGFLHIQSTDSFICSVLFADEEKKSLEIIPDVLINCKKQLEEYFRGERKQFDFPIEQEGTEFQQRVWNELFKIPFGETISYLALARKLSDEKTIRAAASANGKNKIAIIVPCHRVIGADHKLVGYAGGIKRKQWLLENEMKYSEHPGRLF